MPTRWLIGLVAVVLVAFAVSVATMLAGSLDVTFPVVGQEQHR